MILFCRSTFQILPYSSIHLLVYSSVSLPLTSVYLYYIAVIVTKVIIYELDNRSLDYLHVHGFFFVLSRSNLLSDRTSVLWLLVALSPRDKAAGACN
jgi:hypothetical protein